MSITRSRLGITALAVLLAAAAPPSVPAIDAPELAALGPDAVGVRTLTLTQPAQVDVLAGGAVRDQVLAVELWYPARRGGTPAIYRATLPAEPPHPPVAFSVPGIAVRDAAPAGTAHPLVIVSHGYSNDPVAMSWLTENLASKGYVVAAIRHDDPDISDTAKFAGPLLRRPADIAFVARTLAKQLGSAVDPARIALIGYSMGGYGVLTAAGATIDPKGPMVAAVPPLAAYARGGAHAADLAIPGLKAVVAIAPAGGGQLAMWGADGLAALKVPLLLIAGDRDGVVDYASGARAIFAGTTGSDRYLLTFRFGGHAIGLNPAPPEMQSSLWDHDWFEDPVWRKARINGIDAHFITAFLDRAVRGNIGRSAYLDVATVVSDDGVWPAADKAPYDAFSPGSGAITVWKGFQRRHASGLELRHAKVGEAPQ